MAIRKVWISGLTGGERFRISTLDKTPLCKLREKCIWQQEDARPDEANLASLSGQKFPPWQTVSKGKNCLHTAYSAYHPKLREWHLCLMDIHGLYKSGTTRTLWNPHHQEGKGQQDTEGTHMGHLLLNLSPPLPLSLRPPHSLPFFYFCPSPPHICC